MSAAPGNSLKIHVVNVGQGACVLFELPGKKFGLIDCFGLCTGEGVVPWVLSQLPKDSDAELVFVAVTHPHMDHIMGLSKVLEFAQDHYGSPCTLFIESPIRCWDVLVSKYLQNKVLQEKIIAGKDITKDKTRRGMLLSELARVYEVIHEKDLAEDYKNHLTPNSARQTIKICDGLWCDVLAPPEFLHEKNVHNLISRHLFDKGLLKGKPRGVNLNECSLGLRFIYAPSWTKDECPSSGAVIMVGGDAEPTAWNAALGDAKSKIGHSHVIISPHHGGKGNTKRLWKAISNPAKPPTAIISCGSFSSADFQNHPAIDTLKAMANYGARIYCTNLGAQCTSPDARKDTKSQRRPRGAARLLADAATLVEMAWGRSKVPEKFGDAAVREYSDECSGTKSIEVAESGVVSPASVEVKCWWKETIWPKLRNPRKNT